MGKTWRQSLSPRPGDSVRGKWVGSGSCGMVHLAMNKATGGLFVVKSAQSEAALRSLLHEAKILEALNSPHVRPKGANGENQLNLFIEYMAGGSLFDIAKKFGRALEGTVVRLYTKEILLGLKYLRNAKLVDFGYARRINELGTNKYLIGTPLWMAFEVLRNEWLDFVVDIWSLGCIVIEMATRKPSWGDKVSNLVTRVMNIAFTNEKLRFPIRFSKKGVDFLEKYLERDPKKRWKADDLLN
ncbi:Mitogen-activated protein kinase kinase kinase [Bertholletia excelsa]